MEFLYLGIQKSCFILNVYPILKAWQNFGDSQKITSGQGLAEWGRQGDEQVEQRGLFQDSIIMVGIWCSKLVKIHRLHNTSVMQCG